MSETPRKPSEVIAAKIAEVEQTDPPIMCNECLAVAGAYEEAMEKELARLHQIERAVQDDFLQHQGHGSHFEDAAHQTFLNLRGESWYAGKSEKDTQEMFIEEWVIRHARDAAAGEEE